MRSTDFKPAEHGFAFVNNFSTQPVFDLRFHGLCGGMVYTALDHFNARHPIPADTVRPPDGSPLFGHIYKRQEDSVKANLDKWAELIADPFGWRTEEFFRWGLQLTGGGRLEELCNDVDAGRPVPLGLFAAGGGGFTDKHHQVLAIGYDLGRYDGVSSPADVRILIYNPNHPCEVRCLAPDITATRWREDCGVPDHEWLTYFVDRKYQPVRPPAAPAGSGAGGPVAANAVDELVLEVRTGSDDLRGGNDNVSATVHFRGRPDMHVDNLNGGARWIDHYVQTVRIPIAPMPAEDITGLTLTTSFEGGIGGDNWNIDELTVSTKLGTVWQGKASPLRRFTGSDRTWHIRFR